MTIDDLRERIARSPYHVHNGITLDECEEGRVVMRMQIAEHHRNPQGIVHGGAIAGLLDSVCGLSLRTLLPPEITHRTIQLTITYLRPGRSGLLEAVGTAVHSGSRMGYSEAEVRDEQGKLVARATGTFLRMPEGA